MPADYIASWIERILNLSAGRFGMAAPIHVDPGYRSHRIEVRAAIHRALPHRKSYLGFSLGLVATVVMLSSFGWWLIQSGIIPNR